MTYPIPCTSNSGIPSLVFIHQYEEHHSLQNFRFFECSDSNSYLYIYMNRGSMRLITSEDNYLVESSNLVFLPYSPGMQLKSNGCAMLHFSILYLSGNLLPCFYARYMAQSLSPVLKPLCSNAFTEILTKLQNIPSITLPKSELYVSRLLTDLIADTVFTRDLQLTCSDVPDYLLAIQKQFHNHLEENYTLDSLAHMFHINKYKLIKEFKEFFFLPPMQYLLNLRLKKAQELLRLSNLKVSEIAQKTGFSNTNYFIHLFKKKTGFSPSDFRNRPLSN